MDTRKRVQALMGLALTALLVLGLPLVATAQPPNKSKGKNQQAMQPAQPPNKGKGKNQQAMQPAQQLVQILVPQYVQVPGYGTVIQYVPVLVPQPVYAPRGFTGNGRPKGNNGVGNGIDPPPPGNPPINDGPGTGPGRPGNRGGKPAGR